jgi:hypothetical protein
VLLLIKMDRSLTAIQVLDQQTQILAKSFSCGKRILNKRTLATINCQEEALAPRYGLQRLLKKIHALFAAWDFIS